MKSNVFVIAFWTGVLTMILISLIPNVSLPTATIDVGIEFRFTAEAFAHILGFALLMWIYAKAYGLSGKGVLLVLALAVASELIQHFFTANRNLEVKDITYNIIGVAVGVLLVRISVSVARKRDDAEAQGLEAKAKPNDV